MPDPILVYATAPDAATAERIAEALVDERLAACVNIVPGALSIYRWEGAIQKSPEFILFAKSTRERAEALAARIADLHPFDVPAVLVVPVNAKLSRKPFAEWIDDQCSMDGDAQ